MTNDYIMTVGKALGLIPDKHQAGFREYILSRADVDASLLAEVPRGFYILSTKDIDDQKKSGRTSTEIFATIDVERSYIATDSIFRFVSVQSDMDTEVFTLLHNMVKDLHRLICNYASTKSIDSNNLSNNFSSFNQKVTMIERKTNLNTNLK